VREDRVRQVACRSAAAGRPSGMLALMISIGHRSGLFDAMAALPPGQQRTDRPGKASRNMLADSVIASNSTHLKRHSDVSTSAPVGKADDEVSRYKTTHGSHHESCCHIARIRTPESGRKALNAWSRSHHATSRG